MHPQVSHQLGLPPPADAAVFEKLTEQVRKTAAENRALKEKLDDKLEELRFRFCAHGRARTNAYKLMCVRLCFLFSLFNIIRSLFLVFVP